MRIALSSREKIWGGGEHFLVELAEAFTQLGHQVALRVFEDSAIKKALPDTSNLARRSPADFDLLIANDFRSIWESIIFDGFKARTLIVHGEWQLSRARALILKASHVKVYTASSSVASFAKSPKIGLLDAETLPLGPKPMPEPKPDASFSNRLGARPIHEIVLGTVARLDPIKRLDLFCRIVNSVGCLGHIVTQKPETPAQRQMLEHVRGYDRIRVTTTGLAEHIWANADAFFSTSKSESLGIAHLEALQHGLPVITLAQGGPADFLTGSLSIGDLSDVPVDEVPHALLLAIRELQKTGDKYHIEAMARLRARGPQVCATQILAKA